MGLFTTDGEMSVEWGRPVPLYFPGETIQAVVTYTPQTDITLNCVTITLCGEEHTCYSDNHNRKHHLAVHSTPIFTINLMREERVTEVAARSTLRFPIQVEVPSNIPWSMSEELHAYEIPGRDVVCEAHYDDDGEGQAGNNVRYFIKMDIATNGVLGLP
ncbi:hypothetical protein KIPB_004034, partial [Kipferlia bialata]|eukprot:g4034.t1